MTEQIEGIQHFDGRIREGDISASLLHILDFFTIILLSLVKRRVLVLYVHL